MHPNPVVLGTIINSGFQVANRILPFGELCVFVQRFAHKNQVVMKGPDQL